MCGRERVWKRECVREKVCGRKIESVYESVCGRERESVGERVCGRESVWERESVEESV